MRHALTHPSPRQSSISKSEDIVAHNRKNGRIKQGETEMGVDGLLGKLQWLPLHYNGLRRRPGFERPAARDCRTLAQRRLYVIRLSARLVSFRPVRIFSRVRRRWRERPWLPSLEDEFAFLCIFGHNLSYIFHWVVGYDLSLESLGCPFSALFFEWMVGGCEIAYVVQKAC
jgi:hypothetical protein